MSRDDFIIDIYCCVADSYAELVTSGMIGFRTWLHALTLLSKARTYG